MSYILATMESTVRWYQFDRFKPIEGDGFLLSEVLDLKKSPTFETKETAKIAAESLGLQSWRYVRI